MKASFDSVLLPVKSTGAPMDSVNPSEELKLPLIVDAPY